MNTTVYVIGLTVVVLTAFAFAAAPAIRDRMQRRRTRQSR